MLKVNELWMLQDVAIERLRWSRRFAEALLAGLSGEQLIAQAGGVGNHPLWVIGHLAQSEAEILSLITGGPTELPERYAHLFRGGSTPTGNRADYPATNELLDAMHVSRQRMIAWIESLDEESARQRTPEALQMFAPNHAAVPFALVAHELFHLGQIATVRAALGLPRLHA